MNFCRISTPRADTTGTSILIPLILPYFLTPLTSTVLESNRLLRASTTADIFNLLRRP